MEIVSSREFRVSPEELFRAFSDPALLAQWWGPKGFTNTFHEFQFVPGGQWRFTMHGPDGRNYEIQKRFVEVVAPARIVMDHVQPMHSFRMTMTYAPTGCGSRLTWVMRFEDGQSNDELRKFITQANEENFDRLEAFLAPQADPVGQFIKAMRADDAAAVRKLLGEYPTLRARLNERGPHGPAITHARSVAMVDALMDAGADPNLKTDWWAGGFGLLHTAPLEVARHAAARGAFVDIHAAARLGMTERVRELVEGDPSLVHANGGDGQTALHFASTIEIAELLLAHGADINARDVDHESTPVQHMIKERQEVARYLVERGAQADVFIGAALGDLALIERELAKNIDALRMRVSEEFFPMVGGRSGGTIYQWTLGWHVSPHQVARKFGHTAAFEALMRRSPLDVQLVNACWLADEQRARQILAGEPNLVRNLQPGDIKQAAHAARNNEPAALKLMLKLGWPVMARGQHQATVLHWAAWHGSIPMLEDALGYSPDLEALDADFKATPVGWAIHASEHGWNSPGADYVGTLKRLFAEGANRPEQISGAPHIREFLAQSAC